MAMWTPKYRESCSDTKLVMTQTEALAVMGISNHKGSRDPLAYHHKHNPYIDQSVKDMMKLRKSKNHIISIML